jgi:two-component system cell cycle response regulator DivK
MITQTKSPTKNRILYIDDDDNNGNLMKRVLEAEGYRVSLAPTGSMGLAQANREQPDLILLDIFMPDLNGYEVARRLRQMERTKDTPILAISVSRKEETKYLSVQAGCNGYITKPIDVDLIAQQIGEFLL